MYPLYNLEPVFQRSYRVYPDDAVDNLQFNAYFPDGAPTPEFGPNAKYFNYNRINIIVSDSSHKYPSIEIGTCIESSARRQRLDSYSITLDSDTIDAFLSHIPFDKRDKIRTMLIESISAIMKDVIPSMTCLVWFKE